VSPFGGVVGAAAVWLGTAGTVCTGAGGVVVACGAACPVVELSFGGSGGAACVGAPKGASGVNLGAELAAASVLGFAAGTGLAVAGAGLLAGFASAAGKGDKGANAGLAAGVLSLAASLAPPPSVPLGSDACEINGVRGGSPEEVDFCCPSATVLSLYTD
jgi:hypothetical protein